MLSASEPTFDLATREGEAAQSQFATRDYGRVGDQRPFQVVFPAYPAPKFLSRHMFLQEALHECGTLCQLKGKPFRLVKWGARVPCFPCKTQNRGQYHRLPSLRIHSPGALAGFPEATPIADFDPKTGVVVYGPDGQPKRVGDPNFIVTRAPFPPPTLLANWPPLPQRYLEAVQSAQYLASTTGKNTYLCSSMGGDCNRPNSATQKWVPVVYVQPGGLVRRYHSELELPNSPHGSQVATTPVTESEFQELLRQSAGASRMAFGT